MNGIIKIADTLASDCKGDFNLLQLGALLFGVLNEITTESSNDQAAKENEQQANELLNNNAYLRKVQRDIIREMNEYKKRYLAKCEQNKRNILKRWNTTEYEKEQPNTTEYDRIETNTTEYDRIRMYSNNNNNNNNKDNNNNNNNNNTQKEKEKEKVKILGAVDVLNDLKAVVFNSEYIEKASNNLAINATEYHRLANEILTEWEMNRLPPTEITPTHFYSVLRIKSEKYLKQNSTTDQEKAYQKRQNEFKMHIANKLGKRGIPFEATYHPPEDYEGDF